jgi:hypothetical protein
VNTSAAILSGSDLRDEAGNTPLSTCSMQPQSCGADQKPVSRSASLDTPKPASERSLGGTPRWTGPSTNHSCQPETQENSQVKTWASASTLGVELGPPRCLSSNRRERAAKKNLRNVGDTGEGDAGRCCQQNSHSELGQKGSGSPLSTLLEVSPGPFDDALCAKRAVAWRGLHTNYHCRLTTRLPLANMQL